MAQRLALHGITRRFGALLANDGIDLVVAPGEIHALLGENGAGKSTLTRIVGGLLQPDRGSIAFDGQVVDVPDPRAARALGIGTVSQHFTLFEAMTINENVALGLPGSGRSASLADRIRALSRQYGLPLEPSRPVRALSVGERQRVEIVRALLGAPRLLIMDEPTAVLTPGEVAPLFATLRRLAADEVSILYVSHRLDEVRALCHRATVLRQGRVVARCDPRVETAASLGAAMLGGAAIEEAMAARGAPGAAPGPVRLALGGLSLPPSTPGATALDRIDLALRGGEIVGIAGVAGNGQDQLMAAITGELLAPDAGAVRIDGTPAGRLGPGARRRLGLGAVPAARNGHASLGEFSLADNALLTGRERAGLARRGWLRRRRARNFADAVVDAFDVKAGAARVRARTLSGGNLQKFVVGREILQDPSVLAVSQPTWGIDAGATARIHAALRARAARGAAVLVISHDLDELLRIADRIAVMNAGALSPARPAAALTAEALGLLMGGVRAAAPVG